MQKRIVVLGGVGFIGAHLCLRLLAQGHEVFCVDLRDTAYSPLLRDADSQPLFHYVHHNITLPFAIRCDEIYNLASPVRVQYDKPLPVDTLKVNIAGSLHALDNARAELARVVFASSGDIYGSLYRNRATEPDNSCSANRILSEGKRTAEALHRAYLTEFGVDTRIARLFNTYGSGAELMDQRVVMKMVVAALQNRDITIYGCGEQRRTFCWVEDTVEGLVRLMQAQPTTVTRTLDVGSRQELTIRCLAETILDLTGSRSRIVHGKERPDDVQQRVPDIETTRRELGWQPTTTLHEGLRRTISYAEKELSNKSYATMTWAEMN